MSPVSRSGQLFRFLRANLGMPGLALGVFSILSFTFGVIVLVLETERLREIQRGALRPVIAGWVRSLPLDYLGSTLADYVDRWTQARDDDRALRLKQLRAALAHLGELFDRPEMRRTRLIDLIALDLGPPENEEGPPLASWRPRYPRHSSPQDRVDRVPVLELGPQGPPLVELTVRYRMAPEIETAATALEARYRRLALALLGLSLFPLLCLLYMGLQASTLRQSAAREAAHAATLDLADRTCHELGNVAFVLTNERRNLTDHLATVERFLTEGPPALEAAERRAGLDGPQRQKLEEALARELGERGLGPEVELRGGLTIARDVCRQIVVCSNYIALTVRELDSYLKESSIPLKITSVSMSTCLDDALALLSPRLEAAGARIERHRDESVMALADRRLLVHAVVNLLKNAVEAAGVKEALTIQLIVREDGPNALLEVRDDGPGVAPELLPRLFDDGFTTKGPGRGRGLAIVRESIHAQHGHIEVQSQLGRGTTFRVRLPGVPPAPSPPPPQPAAKALVEAADSNAGVDLAGTDR